MFKRAIPKANQDQQSRQDKARERGCVCCRMECEQRTDIKAPSPYDLTVFGTGMPVEVHHQTSQGRQIGQDETICLCVWHHKAICIPGVTSTQMLHLYGPSLAKGSKPFHARYGSNAAMLDYQNQLIGETNANPSD